MSDPTDRPTQPRKPRRETTQLGGRTLSPATLMMGHGYDPMLSEGALKPPIFLTSTFVFPSAAAGKHHFEGITGKRPGGADGLVYSRFNGPNQEILEGRLSVWDGAEEALVFSSGMTAICVLMMAYCSQGDVIVHSGPLYAATEGFVAKVLSKYGVTYVDFPAGATREELDAVIAKAKGMAADQGGKVAMIYLESPGNPTNALVDIEAVRDARDAALDADVTPIAIDNTFLGPLWQSPLKHGADIVAYSLTKYAGGHSDLVAGGVTGAKKWLSPVRALRNTMGGICDPNTAWMLLRSLETLEIRMQRATENAIKVCDYLKDHPKVEGVGFLGLLKDGRQKDIYDRHCTGPGSTFSVFIKGGEAESFRFLDALRIAKLAVSLGGTETLASHPAAMTHLSVPDARKQAMGITDNLVRIS
ncbi:MAG: cystathionine gamma-synthase family protein, partial [Croceibacterium sp.]